MGRRHGAVNNSRGHVWETIDYGSGPEVYASAFNAGEFHNGPRCTVCGYGYCEHCNDGPQIECPGVPLEDVPEGYDDSKLDPFMVSFSRRGRA